MDAPALDAQCVALVKQNLEHMPERFVTCISTLRSLVTNKVGVRYEALQVLLDLCVHPYDKMRRTSIVAVKKWNVDQEDIDARVEAYSIRVLHQLTEEAKEEEGEGWTEKEVVRHAELYFVLCTKKPSLLKELFSVYTQSSETVQEAIRAHIVNMIKSIGMKSSDLISLLRECPEGTESLVIRIIAILCESKPPTREIMATVESLSTERSVDVQSLEPILAVVVGDGGCGKTSLLVVYQKKAFPAKYVPTVFENYIANVQLETGKMVELALWDTAGQEDYDRLRPLSYPETDVILICFAINLRTSFTNVQDRWLPEVTHFCENVPKLLVGTKLDYRQNQDEIKRLGSVGQRLITEEEGRQLAKEIGASYYECSAMQNINVDLVIEAATRAAVAGSMKKLHKRFCKIL
ncbi:hypothetical protein G6F29_007249 [Rhizopus arrhizus]|nr:hypothetical protein G6F32_004587 [Rhizopus arrhizus]KAG0981205.1 hypothetical protein G6F29_007249 [Rhizopus arrhizus]KAG1008772.1 hypothetical protein G6F27_006192 [Rhizopus arrhizus]KAG1069825.1 hypothetical protein G6F41_005689 [Rhizopus arrhizus]KAG1282969.1 hypothetical protein G6F65_004635 [Rhizopus arrhizus]